MHPLQGEAGAPGAHLRRLNSAASLALAVLAACNADLRSTDPNLSVRDADPPADVAARPDVEVDPVRCVEDRYGPSLPDLPAADLALGEYQALVLCPGRPDVFALDVRPGTFVMVSVVPAIPGLRVERAGEVIGAALPWGAWGPVEVTGGERIVFESDTSEPVTYALTISDYGMFCDAQGGVLLDPLDCLSMPRVQVHQVAAGTRVTACRTLAGAGELLLQGHCEGAGDVPLVWGRQRGAGTLCRRLGPFPTDRDCGFRWTPGRLRPVRSVPAPGDGATTAVAGAPQTWRGRLSLSAANDLVPPVGDAWLGAVEVIGPDGAVTGAATVSDAASEADVSGFVAPEAAGELVLAATAKSPTATVVVSPGQPGAEPWRISLASATGDPAAGDTWTLDEAQAPEMAAAHVVAVLAAGLERIPSRVSLPFPDVSDLVHVRWAPGRAEPCGTCFMPGGFPYIELSGRPGDPDEWDDAVILHELGHWVATAYGRDDSPGGAHDGSRVAGAIAWSEGFAEFFAAWQLGSPELVDRRADGPRIRNLDTMSEDDPLAVGTSDGTVEGLISERFIAALLWDLHDGEDPQDSELFEAGLFGARRHETDRGPPGFDLVDYLDSLTCLDQAAGESAANLVRERGFPYEPPDERTCP